MEGNNESNALKHINSYRLHIALFKPFHGVFSVFLYVRQLHVMQ